MDHVIPFRSDPEITAAIPAVISHLKRHGVLAYPSETIYGLGTATDEESVHALVTLKGREENKPFLLLISSIAMLRDLGIHIPLSAAKLAQVFWPGPLTIVFPVSSSNLPKALVGSNGGVAVRWTPHDGLSKLIKAYGAPITSTSANPAGKPLLNSPGEITSTWGEAVAKGKLLILDGSVGDGTNLPSTIVDCTQSKPKLVRSGAISVEKLREVIPDIE